MNVPVVSRRIIDAWSADIMLRWKTGQAVRSIAREYQALRIPVSRSTIMRIVKGAR